MKKVLGIIGPTASGKSAIGRLLADTGRFRIINADSCQVYRGLEVLSAQKDAGLNVEKSAILAGNGGFLYPEHVLYGILDCREKINAAEWLKLAILAVNESFLAGKIPVLLGGTGLYFKAFQNGFVNLPKITENTQNYLDSLSLEEIRNQLQPAILAKFKDRQRLARALGIFLQTGQQITAFFEQKPDPGHDFEVEIFALLPPKEQIWDNVFRRLESIFPAILAEVSRNLDLNSHITLGFDEIRAFLVNRPRFLSSILADISCQDDLVKSAIQAGFSEFEDCDFQQNFQRDLEKLKQEIFVKTRQYAKRQRTFIKTMEISAKFTNNLELFEFVKSFKFG